MPKTFAIIIIMRKTAYFWFLVPDIKNLISKHKKELIVFLSTFVFGLVVGIIIASSSQSDYSGAFMSILSDEYNPFRSFGIYTAILFFLTLLCFCTGIKSIFTVILLALIFFSGYVFGRISCFSVVENVFWGIISILIFVLPNASVLLSTTYYTYCKMREKVVCGSLKNSKPCVKICLSVFMVGTLLLFVFCVILGGVIDQIINIV